MANKASPARNNTAGNNNNIGGDGNNVMLVRERCEAANDGMWRMVA